MPEIFPGVLGALNLPPPGHPIYRQALARSLAHVPFCEAADTEEALTVSRLGRLLLDSYSCLAFTTMLQDRKWARWAQVAILWPPVPPAAD